MKVFRWDIVICEDGLVSCYWGKADTATRGVWVPGQDMGRQKT